MRRRFSLRARQPRLRSRPPASLTATPRPPRFTAAKVKFQHVGRDEAGRAPVRSFRGGYRRRTHRTAKADGGDGCVRAARAARLRKPRVTRELPRVRLAMRSGSDEDEGPGRGPRLAPVREPEPINDFERARLENIRRNQEALAGECQASTPSASAACALTRACTQRSWAAWRRSLQKSARRWRLRLGAVDGPLRCVKPHGASRLK